MSLLSNHSKKNQLKQNQPTCKTNQQNRISHFTIFAYPSFKSLIARQFMFHPLWMQFYQNCTSQNSLGIDIDTDVSFTQKKKPFLFFPLCIDQSLWQRYTHREKDRREKKRKMWIKSIRNMFMFNFQNQFSALSLSIRKYVRERERASEQETNAVYNESTFIYAIYDKYYFCLVFLF